MNTSATNLSTSATPPPAIQVAGSGAGAATGAESASSAQTALRVAAVASQGTVVVPLDKFSKESGPDVSVRTEAGLVRVHAVFQMDPSTRELSVSVVDEAGRLIRTIPSESVSRMIAAMATYRGR
jgi:hypothetical protein